MKGLADVTAGSRRRSSHHHGQRVSAGNGARRASQAPATLLSGHADAPERSWVRACRASAARRLGHGFSGRPGGIREGIGHILRMERQRVGPGPVEGRAGKAAAQAMGAGRRHARSARRPRDVAGGEQDGEETALPLRRPARAGGMGRAGRGRIGGLLFHPTGWSRGNPIRKGNFKQRVMPAKAGISGEDAGRLGMAATSPCKGPRPQPSLG